MSRPSFVVVGAMKAGSTTIYEDLYGNPSVFLSEKELGYLLDPEITSPAGVRRYEALFAPARPGQVLGDVSADYAKLPESQGMAERARELLGPEYRVVYSLRNPVDRLVSHHHHILVRREISESDIDRAVRTVPTLVQYSRYATQLAPFVHAVGRDRVHLICFEDYTADRAAGFGSLAAFLELAERSTSTAPDTAYNAASTTTVAVGTVRRLLSSSAYRKAVRPLMSKRVRDRVRHAVLPTVSARPAPPSADTVDHVLDLVAGELEALPEHGFAVPASWGPEQTQERYARLRAEHA